MRKRFRSAGIPLLVLAACLLAPVLSADAEITLKNEQLEVLLDSRFPRVLGYHLSSGQRLAGAVAADRPMIELNGAIHTPAEFRISSRPGVREASYRIDFPALGLRLDLAFRLEGNELLMKLARVEESGNFRLDKLYFPGHYLLRMSALTSQGMMYRGEYRMRPWKQPSLPGSYAQGTGELSLPHFGVIADEDGERFPVSVNWAAMFGSRVCATIANNIGFWKLASQFLGFSGQASDFALWNGTYHYRLRGKVQPLLESRVGILTNDENGDGRVDWMEAALWHRRRLPEPNPLYTGPTYIYKIINAWGPPDNKPITSFEECLPIIKSIAGLTGSLPQIVFLVGWQYEGHDTGYPSIDRVNQDLGGLEKLRWLATEAKKYNAVISYHINLDDTYQEHPGWDPRVLCLRRSGEPYSRGFNSMVSLQRYQISHTKEVESGYFQRRAQAFLNAVPVEKTIQLDTLECSNISFGPGENIGANDELELGCKEIVKWFGERGIDVTSEGPVDGLYGMLSWILHRQQVTDPFQLIMLHNKVYGGGKPLKPVNELLGWSTNMPVQARPSEKYSRYPVYSTTETSDTFYLGTLLQYYLNKKELVFLGPEGDEYVARFRDGTISRQKSGGPLLVREGNVVIADGANRLIPLNDSEIRFYAASGGERFWTLPAAWSRATAALSELTPEGERKIKDIELENNRLRLKMEPHRPYVLRRTPKRVVDNRMNAVPR